MSDVYETKLSLDELNVLHQTIQLKIGKIWGTEYNKKIDEIINLIYMVNTYTEDRKKHSIDQLEKSFEGQYDDMIKSIRKNPT